MVRRCSSASRVARLLATGPPRHRVFLLEMLPRQSVGAEVGVHLGDFSAEILRAVAPRELHLIDPWRHEASEAYSDDGQAEMDARHQRICERLAAEMRAGQVKIHRSSSADALRALPDAYLDWIYIDGNHLYEYVKEDLELALRKVRPGGPITGDDYREGGWWQGGVKKAVDEIVQREPVERIAIRNQQFVLRRR
jgi:predicted O-methyltransferase YrrM